MPTSPFKKANIESSMSIRSSVILGFLLAAARQSTNDTDVSSLFRIIVLYNFTEISLKVSRLPCRGSAKEKGAPQGHHKVRIPDFKDLPNAAVSVFPGITDESAITVFWNVMWDDPIVRAAGNCTTIGGKIEGFEDYTKMNQ